MDRLSEKFAKAGGIVQRQALKIEKRLDDLIARESAIEAKTDQAFQPHEATLDATERGLDAFEHQLAGLTNGAPLEPSSDSPATPVHTDTRTFDRMG